jgi:hypothetical protein
VAIHSQVSQNVNPVSGFPSIPGLWQARSKQELVNQAERLEGDLRWLCRMYVRNVRKGGYDCTAALARTATSLMTLRAALQANVG